MNLECYERCAAAVVVDDVVSYVVPFQLVQNIFRIVPDKYFWLLWNVVFPAVPTSSSFALELEIRREFRWWVVVVVLYLKYFLIF